MELTTNLDFVNLPSNQTLIINKFSPDLHKLLEIKDTIIRLCKDEKFLKKFIEKYFSYKNTPESKKKFTASTFNTIFSMYNLIGSKLYFQVKPHENDIYEYSILGPGNAKFASIYESDLFLKDTNSGRDIVDSPKEVKLRTQTGQDIHTKFKNLNEILNYLSINILFEMIEFGFDISNLKKTFIGDNTTKYITGVLSEEFILECMINDLSHIFGEDIVDFIEDFIFI